MKMALSTFWILQFSRQILIIRTKAKIRTKIQIQIRRRKIIRRIHKIQIPQIQRISIRKLRVARHTPRHPIRKIQIQIPRVQILRRIHKIQIQRIQIRKIFNEFRWATDLARSADFNLKKF